MLVVHTSSQLLFFLHLLLFLKVQLIDLHLLNEFVEVNSQLYLFLRCVSEGEVLKALDHNVALVRVNRLLVSRGLIKRILVRYVLRLYSCP